MTIFVVIMLAAAIALWALVSVRRRAAARRAAEAAAAQAKALRKSRVPEVSSNLKGVTASQTIEPVKSSGSGGTKSKNLA